MAHEWKMYGTPSMDLKHILLHPGMFLWYALFGVPALLINGLIPICTIALGIVVVRRIIVCKIAKLPTSAIIATAKFAGDLFITVNAAGLLGFYGLRGSAMALLFSNFISLVFFLPRKKKGVATA